MENKTSPGKLPVSQAISLIVTFCTISALFIYLIYSGNFVFGSDLGQWIYSYFRTIQSIPLWIPLAVLVMTGIIIYFGSKLIQNHEKLTLLGCFILAVIIQILIQKIYPYSLDQMIKSNVSNSFYTPALKYSTNYLLSQYQNIVSTFPLHARTNMPGKILFYQFLLLFTPSLQMMGYLIISISTLGGLLLYGICKRLFLNKNTALYAFVLYVLIPCKQIFFPILNTVTPLFILLCLYLFIVYLDSKKKVHLILLGISIYFLVLFEPSPLVAGILFIGIFIHSIVQKRISLKELISVLLIPTGSFLAVFILFIIIFHFNLLQSFQYVMNDATNFNMNAGRSYQIWLRENVKEFFFSTGLPVMMIFIYFVINMVSEWKTSGINILRWSIDKIYTLSLILTFCVVLFLGINRGETTRLWIYLAVFFQVPAAFFMTKKVQNNTLFFFVACTLIAQSIISLQRVGFIIP